MLPNPVLPPAAKIAVAPTPAPEPVAPATPAPVVETSDPTPAPAEEKKPTKRDFAKETSERIQSALDEASGKKKAPAATEKPADETKATPAGDDASLNSEIEAETKGMDSKAKQGFTKLRYELRDAKRQLTEAQELAKKAADLETQLAEAKKTATPAADPSIEKLRADYEALQRRVEEQESELTVGRLEATQAYKEAVGTPKKAVETTVAAFAEKHKLDAGKLMSALSDNTDAGTERLSEILADAEKPISQLEQLKLIAQSEKLQTIAEKEAVLRANAKETLEKISARTSTETEAQKNARQAAMSAALDTEWKTLVGAMPILSTVEGDEPEVKAWNAAIEDAAKFGKETNFETLDATIQAGILHRAAAHPLLAGAVTALQSQVDAQVQELAKLSAELEKFRAARPSADARGGTSSADASAPRSGDWAADVSARIAASLGK